MKIDFTPRNSLQLEFRPHVYMRDKTHSYLWIEDRDNQGVFLTLESGSIEVVYLSRPNGPYYVFDPRTREWWELTVAPEKSQDFLKAVRSYWTSQLTRSEEAERIMTRLLGIPEGTSPTRKSYTAAPQNQEFPKPVRKERAAKPQKGPKAAAGYTLTDLCQELGIGASEARKRLRGVVEKPGSKWEWPTKEAAAGAISALSK